MADALAWPLVRACVITGPGASVSVGVGVETVVRDGDGAVVVEDAVTVGIGSTVGPVGVVELVAPPALVGEVVASGEIVNAGTVLMMTLPSAVFVTYAMMVFTPPTVSTVLTVGAGGANSANSRPLELAPDVARI